MLKRIFDVIFSFAAFLFFLPLMGIIAVLIKREDSGPVFYRGLRTGIHEKPFRMFKFRTMVVNADKIGGPSTSDDDPRLLKIGKFLRNYKLDELPQLINIIKGEMSFVGPRPEVPVEVATYSNDEKRIFSVRPGITDWASLTFHNEGEILKGSKDPHQTYREKIRPGKIKLALKYVDEQSFLTDIKIIFQTIFVLFKTRT